MDKLYSELTQDENITLKATHQTIKFLLDYSKATCFENFNNLEIRIIKN
jgi:hypothetical protein